MVNTTKEKNLAGWLFMRWFTEPEQQTLWAQTINYFPIRKSVAAGMTDYFTKNPQYKSAFDLLDSTKGEPPIVAWSVARTPLITDAFSDILDGKPVEERFAQLNDDANAALEANKPGAALPTPRPTATPTAAATAAS